MIWTFLDDETQDLFYDLQGKLSDSGKATVENKVLSKIDHKGKPIVGITQVRLEQEKIIIVGTFGECSFPNSLLKPDVVL